MSFEGCVRYFYCEKTAGIILIVCLSEIPWNCWLWSQLSSFVFSDRQIRFVLQAAPSRLTCPWCCCWLLILRSLGWCWWRNLTCRTRRTWSGWSPSWLRWSCHVDCCHSQRSKGEPEPPGQLSETLDQTATSSEQTKPVSVITFILP